jgi:hypothetical protein
MRNTWLLGAAALLAVAAPGVASATSGYVGAGYTALDDDDSTDKDGSIDLNGAVVTDLTGSWDLQFNADYSAMDHGTHDDPFTTTTVHAFTRNPNWAAGGFVGMFNRGGSNFWDAGIEGQLYLGSFTLTGAYTHADESNCSGCDSASDWVDLSGDFFLSPNTSIGANVSWYDDAWESESGYLYGVNIEHQFAGSPFSVGAGYLMLDGDYDGGGSHQVDSFSVFARWNFGTSDLRERSTEGASMPGGGEHLVRGAIGSW